MSQSLLKAVANCGRCIQYEAKGQLPPMQPIICTEPMELVHIDYVGMEVTVATDKKCSVERVGGCRALHPICAGICYQKPYGEDNGPGAVQQLLLCVWFSPMPYVRSGNGILWEGHCGCVQPAGCRKDPYYPVSPSNQWIG